MSNIKVFPMAMLPGWPFAPTQLQAPHLKIVCTSFSNSIQPVWGLVCGLPIGSEPRVATTRIEFQRTWLAAGKNETVGPVIQAGVNFGN